MAAPTTRSFTVWQIENGDDFLQLKNPSGSIQAWIDQKGVYNTSGSLGSGSLGAGSPLVPVGNVALPATRMFYVDGGRSDSYTPNGTVLKPFNSIGAAIAQIVSNGDNASAPYTLIINDSTYVETVDLSNPAIYDLSIIGRDSNCCNISPGVGIDALRVVNNPNLTRLALSGLAFNGRVLVSDTHTGAAAKTFNYELICHACLFNNYGGGTPQTQRCIDFTNCNYPTFFGCVTAGDLYFTNVAQVYFYGHSAFDFGWFTNGLVLSYNGSNPVPAGDNGYTHVILQSGLVPIPDVVGVNCVLDLLSGTQLGQSGETSSISGTLNTTFSSHLSTTTIQSTGVVNTTCGAIASAPTIVSGGVINREGLVGAASFSIGPNQGTNAGCVWTSYAGDPTSHLTLGKGSLCSDITNGALYINVDGTNTGWKLVTHA